MFKVSGLHSGYDGTIIIEDIELNVQTNEIVNIIGPNGSGKSTLLKSIFGIVKPQQGKIEFLNESITGMKPFRIFEKGISYVPQVENIFSNLTISENLDIGFYTSKIKDTENELDKMEDELKSLCKDNNLPDISKNLEMLLTYIMFPNIAFAFFKGLDI